MSTEGEATAEVAPTVEQPVVEAPVVEAEDQDDGGEESGDEGEEQSEDVDLQERKPRVRNASARIDQLTREKSELRRELDRIRLATAPAPISPEGAPKEPTPDQFDDYGDYVKALARHEVAQERARAAAETHASVQQADWSSKVEAAKSTHADYDDVVGSSEVPIRDHVRDALLDADRGPELAYHMATNPEFAQRLNDMSPARAAMELGRLEVSLGKPVAKPVTKAPAPISPLTGGQATMPNLAKAGMDEYIAARRAQGAKF